MTSQYNSLPAAFIEDYLNRHPNETIKFIKKFLESRQDKKIKLTEEFMNELPLGGQIKFSKELMKFLFDKHLSEIKQDPVKLKEFIAKHGIAHQSEVRKDLIASLRNEPTNLDSFMKEIYEIKYEEPQQQKPPMILVLLVDESGSMTEYKTDTLRGCNKFIDEQVGIEKENVTLVVEFFSKKRRTIYDGPLTNVKEKLRDYRPHGGTRLYGAIIDLSDEIKTKINTMQVKHSSTNQKFVKPTVIFTIVTDGDDNESRNITNKDVKNMIEKSDWEFIYLKEENVNLEAGHIGVKGSDHFTYSQKDPRGATRGLTQASGNVTSKRVKIYSNY